MISNDISTLSAVALALVACSAQALAGPPCVPEWSSLAGAPGVSDGYIADLVPWNDGTGVHLYATGSFPTIGGAAGTSMIARWNGVAWAPLGTGLSNPASQYSNAIAAFNGQLYVGGYFGSAGGAAGSAKLARWNGTTWSGVNAQMDSFENSVWALKTFDDGAGEDLYVAGNFITAGGQAISHLARFDGTNFTAVGSGPIAGVNIPLIAIELETWDDGDGEALYVGGRFSSVAGVPASRIAKWDGTAWSALGAGVGGSTSPGMAVYAIEPWNDGSGESLFVAGQSFTTAGGVTTSRVARWDGTQWHSVGGGLNSTVWDLKVFDDGSGEALYAVGLFTGTADGTVAANRIAKWDGKTWSAVGAGVADESVFCALPFDDGSGPALYIGGSFSTVDGSPASGIARFEGCEAQNPGDANGDGVVNVNDLLLVITNWGSCPAPPAPCDADVTDDGTVNVNDLLMVIVNWG